MTAMLWVYGIAAATALALAEHWLRYALVERKRARRVAARLERIRRGRERREREADDREWAAYLARKAEPRLADSLYAQMQAEQMRAMQGVGAQAAQQHMAMGLDPAWQNGGAGAQWPSYVAVQSSLSAATEEARASLTDIRQRQQRIVDECNAYADASGRPRWPGT